MNEDELRNRLRRLNPIPEQVPMESPTSESARSRLEDVMKTETNATVQPPTQFPNTKPKPKSTKWLAVAAAAVVVVVGGIAAVNVAGGDGDSVATGPALELDLGANDITASCLRPSAEILADMSPAFAATVTGIADEQVTLEVTKWYSGGDATTVELHAQAGQAALIAGFDFVVGEDYLITAANGSVNYCGYSGPATPEFTAMFEEAFSN